MSSYAYLRPLLRSVVAHGMLDEAARGQLVDMPAAGGKLLDLPGTRGAALPPVGQSAWDQAQEELSVARGLLAAVATDRIGDALQLAATLLATPLRPSPFETLLEEVGARLATKAGDEHLALALTNRSETYRQRYEFGSTLIGAAQLLADSDLLRTLEDCLEGGDTRAPRSALQPPTYPLEPPSDTSANAAPPPTLAAPSSSSFAPFAAVDDPDTNAYVVTVRHLREARTATFAVHRVHWHDLDSEDPRVSDLVLAFEDDAGITLRSVDPELLSLRLFFGDGPAYDELSTSDGSLFEVEVNPAEGRIYLKLRRPAAWSATGLPPAELWRHLRSCVLITAPG